MNLIKVILNRFLNNEQIVQRLSESYPIRRAAQLLVYYYNKKKATALELKNLAQLENTKLAEKLKKIYEELEERSKKLK